MNKRLTLLLAVLALLLYSCTKKEQGRSDAVSRMLNAQIELLKASKDRITVQKQVWYGGKMEQAMDSAGAAIEILKSLQDMKTGALLRNAGFEKKTSGTEMNGQKLEEVMLERNKSEVSPFRFMSLYRWCVGDSCNQWKGFYLTRAEDNYLYNSSQSYMLKFEGGRLTELTVRSKEKSFFSKPSDFRMILTIRYNG